MKVSDENYPESDPDHPYHLIDFLSMLRLEMNPILYFFFARLLGTRQILPIACVHIYRLHPAVNSAACVFELS